MWYDAAKEVGIMPRRSPFIIDLTPHEKQVLEAEARKYTSPYRDVIRSKIILLAAQGYDNDDIASRLDTPRQIVSKWRKRFFQERLLGLQDQSRGGRPGSFSPSGDRRG
jgi:transposase-like protein